jgi:hypothetical protein
MFDVMRYVSRHQRGEENAEQSEQAENKENEISEASLAEWLALSERTNMSTIKQIGFYIAMGACKVTMLFYLARKLGLLQ